MNKSNARPGFPFGDRHHVNSSMSNDTSIRKEMTEFIQHVNFWITIIEIVMVTFGILGNGLALIVINRRSLRDTSSSVFITYLAIFDTLVLVVHITSLATSHWIHSYILHCTLAYFTDLVTFTSVWIMVIMTLDRCIAVRSPFLAKRFCTTEHARCSIYILIGFACVLFSATSPFIYIIDEHQQKCGVRPKYQRVIRFIKATIFYFVPDFLLLANLFVIYELCMAKRQRTRVLFDDRSANNQSNAVLFNRKQQQLTIMLVTVSLSFYFFTTPAIIDYIYQLHPPRHHNAKRLKMRFLMMNLSVLWLQMSSATNFVFYCLAGSKFRATSLQTIRDVYRFLQGRLNDRDDQQAPRTRRRQDMNGVRLTSNADLGLASRPEDDPDRRRTRSLPERYPFPMRNPSTQPLTGPVQYSPLYRRKASQFVLNVDEL